MAINIAICDDEIACIQMLEKALAAFDHIPTICEPYSSGQALIKDCRENGRRFDAVFLDLEMPGMNGFETAKALRDIDQTCILVFVTSYEKYAVEGYEYDAFRYLVKPVETEKLKRTMNGIAEVLADRHKSFCFSDINKNTIRIDCDDILYFECRNHIIEVHTKSTTYHMRKSISDLEKMYEKEIFGRSHKSFLVNYKHVQKIGDNYIQLYGCSAVIPLSRHFKKSFKTAMLRKEIGGML